MNCLLLLSDWKLRPLRLKSGKASYSQSFLKNNRLNKWESYMRSNRNSQTSQIFIKTSPMRKENHFIKKADKSIVFQWVLLVEIRSKWNKLSKEYLYKEYRLRLIRKCKMSKKKVLKVILKALKSIVVWK